MGWWFACGPLAGGSMQGRRLALLIWAERYGNGLIDLTSRANLQIRGVSHDGHLPLLDGLMRLGLLDPDSETESRRNIPGDAVLARRR
jgi:precorrin-3B synthase